MARWTGTCKLFAPESCKDQRTAEITIEGVDDEHDAWEQMKVAASRRIAHNSNHAHQIRITDFMRHD